MPIYEFYCAPCNTIYSFRSKTINTDGRPPCPRCQTATLERRISTFSVLRSDRAGSDEPDDMQFDEKQLGNALADIGSEAEHLDDKDPRAVARLMRKFSQAAGVEFNGRIEEMMRRLESGEDPDALEAEYGDLDDETNPFDLIKKKSGTKRGKRPKRDDMLYDME